MSKAALNIKRKQKQRYLLLLLAQLHEHLSDSTAAAVFNSIGQTAVGDSPPCSTTACQYQHQLVTNVPIKWAWFLLAMSSFTGFSVKDWKRRESEQQLLFFLRHSVHGSPTLTEFLLRQTKGRLIHGSVHTQVHMVNGLVIVSVIGWTTVTSAAHSGCCV